MDEGRKRVRFGIMAAILTAMHMRTADDLFGTPQGSPRTDRLIAASIQWAGKIMRKIDDGFGNGSVLSHEPKLIEGLDFISAGVGPIHSNDVRLEAPLHCDGIWYP